MFERPDAGERAVLAQLALNGQTRPGDREELQQLAESAGAEVLGVLGGALNRPNPRLFLGTGKADELKDMVSALGAEIVIFDHTLSPAQERNLERLLSCRVLDRTGLILDIFAQRARSFEGKLQVELAQLRHLSTRLVRGWTHLERQKGGIGLRGPGETQLETDRRLLGKRISTLRRRLERIEVQRAQGRRARERNQVPTVALVGYTNAGKSTLFRSLTSSDVYVADQLFATLDPTLRRLTIEQGTDLVLADTVGFVSGLPHELVAAFRATLDEARSADLLLHVVDAGDPQREEHMADVTSVLAEIDAAELPCLEVFNKIDRVEHQGPRLDRDDAGVPRRVWISAAEGEGLDLLARAVAERLGNAVARRSFRLGPTDGRLRAWLFRHARVLEECGTDQGGWNMDVLISAPDFERLRGIDSALEQKLAS